jgi:hypothetical protein
MPECEVRQQSVELAKGKSAIELSTVADPLLAFDALKSAVPAGELDSQIEALSGALGSAFVKKVTLHLSVKPTVSLAVR